MARNPEPALNIWDVLRTAAEGTEGAVLRVILQTEPGKEARMKKALGRFGVNLYVALIFPGIAAVVSLAYVEYTF